MTEGLVSVIVPCFNGEEFLAQALKSVQWQTYAHWECILIDDGSTDRSEKIFHGFAESDNRFRYHYQKNQGLAAARNAGIDLAQGEFIQFLDDDDIIPEHRLERCVEQFRLCPHADVVYTDYVCYQSGEGYSHSLPARIPDGDTFLTFLLDQNRTFVILVHSLIFRAGIIAANKFDTSLGSHSEDVECWMRLAERETRFHYLDEVLAVYRFTGDSLAADESVLLKKKIEVLQRYVEHPAVRAARFRFDAAMSYYQEHLAIGYFMKKAFGEGLATMGRQWPRSGWNGRLKMMGWLLLMPFFSKHTVARVRARIVSNTPFKWGGWKTYRVWTPTESIRQLMISETG